MPASDCAKVEANVGGYFLSVKIEGVETLGRAGCVEQATVAAQRKGNPGGNSMVFTGNGSRGGSALAKAAASSRGPSAKFLLEVADPKATWKKGGMPFFLLALDELVADGALGSP